ncbi:HigA family addiction module antitoxin [Natronoflexus pectinivorans]|uniref:Addiction module HigA family antidote n=1 Tax=Natronoflexus pectinivorans TaxID=682526 RepID=A0A4R2GG99_9BACT|nr:HigA family addiction module antitoxin [Natronoflexus pectinivorans]TCO06981.1 addiction module HigA family antidote [Natronoflexus pectinivorans]
MKRNNSTEPTNGMLTNPMDTGTDEFKDFQAKLLNKAKKRSEAQQREIELLSIKFQMQDYLESEETELKLPGDFLKEYLKTLDITQKKFAHYIEINPSNLNKLIKGERPINYELAIILGKIFNNDPMLWIEIQAKNELKKIRKTKTRRFNSYSLNDLMT